MPLTKTQLIVLGNEYAVAIGAPGFSESVFESWITNRLIHAAFPRGIKRGVNPNWEYADDVLERVKVIVLFRALGAKRHTQLLICLLAFGIEFPTREVGEALAAELRRIVNREQRGRPWFANRPEELARLSDADRARRLNQLPELDSDLAAAGFKIPVEVIFGIGLLLYWGAEGSANVISVVLGNDPNHSTASGTDFAGPFDLLLGLGGAMGPADESSTGHEVLSRVSPRDIEAARALFLLCGGTLSLASWIFKAFPSLKSTKIALAVEKAAMSFLTPEWIVPTIALFVVAAVNLRLEGTR